MHILCIVSIYIYIYRYCVCIHVLYTYIVYVYVYKYCVFTYIYIYAQRLGFAQAFIRGIPFQANANIVATLNSYGKNTWGIREYATPTAVNLEFLWEKQFGH